MSNRFVLVTIVAAAMALAAVLPRGVAAYPFESYGGGAVDSEGNSAIQAGSHPDLITDFRIGTGPKGISQNFRDIEVEFPPGMAFNPTVVPKCTPDQLAGNFSSFGACPTDSQVGVLTVYFINAENELTEDPYPLFNMTTPVGVAGRIAAAVPPTVVNLDGRIRSDGDYGVTVISRDTSQSLGVQGSKVVVWGVPADPSHDAERYKFWPEFGASFPGNPSTQPRLPFVSYFGNCSAGLRTTTMRMNTWQEPDVVEEVEFDHDLLGNPIVAEGCDQVDFKPTVEARPTTNLADSPSGLDVKIHVPQNDDPDGLSVAHLRDSALVLPPGMTVNPSSAGGLGACSPVQVGLATPVGTAPPRFDQAAVTCPESSRLGTVRIDTPLLDEPLKGSLFLASPHENPFGSLLALYIVVDDKRTGVVVKLAGRVQPDAQTGQLRVDFDQNPQVPFEDLSVNLFTGPRGSLKTPLACGSFTSTSTLVPWSAPEGRTATPSDTFAITQGAGGGGCLKSDSEAPNDPTFRAGTTDPTAGAFAPFVLKLARADGTAPLKAIDATLPKGLLGKLAGIPYCSDGALAAAAGKRGRDEQSSPSCPSASQVGSVTVGAGAGSTPLYVSGKAYLAGPYKGAPLSMAIITPAVAGPFDLGTVVVRTRLEVDPESTRIKAVSDEIPTILQGIPLDVRSISVSVDRSQFTLNPTNCNPASVAGGALSVFGQNAAVSNPFQVGGCKALGFKPKLAIRLEGGTKRGRNPALRAVLTTRAGDANIAKAVVRLPHSEFLAQAHIKTICTRVQFAANACPAGSVYGKVKAYSTLLDAPLEGPVYLRSSSNPLPDLVADLNGQIRVDVVGRIDSVKGGIRTSFETVPDAPVSKFVIEMAGGKKSLLENSRDLCSSVNRADVRMDGQNGKTYDSTPVVKAAGCKKAKKKSKRAGRHGSRR